jgi:hypothetical protein
MFKFSLCRYTLHGQHGIRLFGPNIPSVIIQFARGYKPQAASCAGKRPWGDEAVRVGFKWSRFSCSGFVGGNIRLIAP